MYSKSNLDYMDVINTPVSPHVARKCCNMTKSTVQKRQHVVITRIPDVARLELLVLLVAVLRECILFSSVILLSFTTRETACQYRQFLFLWLYLHQMRSSFLCDKWSRTPFCSTAIEKCDSSFLCDGR